MLKLLRKRKAQSTVEYAILVIIIIGALIAIQAYIKRGVQGRLRSAADDIGEQFEPGATNYVRNVYSTGTTTESYSAGVQSSNIVGNESTDVDIQQNLLNQRQTYWGR